MCKVDKDTGKLSTIYQKEVFGLIWSMMPFWIPGMDKDFVVIGSDSGRFIVLEFNQEINEFEKVHQETYGKTGCWRIVPGEFLACDPWGWAVMIGAVEK